ncbi:hypothetical protein RFI_29167 [Reticulomyxa filosa]|uniref:Uncharacterized protein n=1 Tax=Reticulomyxa filosa TaxID=46433 RepID=X6M423_RETFI|nr:hypothetical protein RFI_29167 [Reticulomyxa filosa]|eukprot:ETO08222.1 hypothetical protein RFI_29167 [Reticulomyxa filosa]
MKKKMDTKQHILFFFKKKKTKTRKFLNLHIKLKQANENNSNNKKLSVRFCRSNIVHCVFVLFFIDRCDHLNLIIGVGDACTNPNIRTYPKAYIKAFAKIVIQKIIIFERQQETKGVDDDINHQADCPNEKGIQA